MPCYGLHDECRFYVYDDGCHYRAFVVKHGVLGEVLTKDDFELDEEGMHPTVMGYNVCFTNIGNIKCKKPGCFVLNELFHWKNHKESHEYCFKEMNPKDFKVSTIQCVPTAQLHPNSGLLFAYYVPTWWD